MLAKLVLAAVLAVGVLGRSLPDEEDSFLSKLTTTAYCETDKIPGMRGVYSTFKQCLTNVFSAYEFQQELRQAAMAQSKDLMAKAFCKKSPQMKTCIHPLVTSLAPCLTTSGLRTTRNQLDSALDYFCANDGAKAALFWKEGGKECMDEKKSNIQSCKNTKESDVTRLVGVYGSGWAIPEKERCKLDVRENACVVAAIKTCTNPAPGKIFEGLVNVLGTNCDDEEVTGNGITHEEEED